MKTTFAIGVSSLAAAAFIWIISGFKPPRGIPFYAGELTIFWPALVIGVLLVVIGGIGLLFES